MDTTGPGREQGLNDLERPLEGLRPASPAGLARDRMLFEAGRASAESRRRRWAAAAALAAIAVGLGGLLAREREQRRGLEALLAERDRAPALPAGVAPAAPDPVVVVAAVPPDSYRALSLRISDGGLDELASSAPGLSRPGAPALPVAPLRVRDARGLLDF
jgi:hypothetical protein